MAPLRSLKSRPYGPGRLPNPGAVVGALVAVTVAAVGGWVLASHLDSKPPVVRERPPVTVRTGGVELVLRAGWQPVSKLPRVPGLDGAGARAFAPPDGSSGRMMLTVLEGARAEQLPRPTVAALGVPLGSSRRATVGGLRGVGYTALALRGVSGLVDVYQVPTAAGVVAVTCVATLADPLPVGSCPGDVTTIAARKAAPPDPAAELRRRAPALISALDETRRSGRHALRRAARPATQATAARRLEHAYRRAALRAAAVAPQHGTGAALPRTLRSAAAAYRRLALAASHHSRRGWVRARRAVNAAERRVAAQVDAL